MIAIMRNATPLLFNTLKPKQKDHHFADDIFSFIFLYKIYCIMIPISPKFAHASNNNKTVVLQKMILCA